MDFMQLASCQCETIWRRKRAERWTKKKKKTRRHKKSDRTKSTKWSSDQAKGTFGTLLQDPTIGPNQSFRNTALAAELQHHNPNGYYKDHYLPRAMIKTNHTKASKATNRKLSLGPVQQDALQVYIWHELQQKYTADSTIIARCSDLGFFGTCFMTCSWCSTVKTSRFMSWITCAVRLSNWITQGNWYGCSWQCCATDFLGTKHLHISKLRSMRSGVLSEHRKQPDTGMCN